MRFDVNAKAAFGQRASGIVVRHRSTGAWEALDPGRTCRLFVLSFNATGGDGYKTLAAVPAARRPDIGVLDADVFFDSIESQPREPVTGLRLLRKLPVELSSTQSYVAP